MNLLLADVPSSLSGRSAPSYADLAVLPSQRAEADVVRGFLADPALTAQQRESVSAMATDLVEAARTGGGVGGMERLMAAFSLSRDEGRALMELAEAFLRIPDAETRDALIRDKLAGRDWSAPGAPKPVRAAAGALGAAGAVVAPDTGGLVTNLIKRLGRPVVRACIDQAMRLMGRQFVIAPTIGLALAAAGRTPDTRYSFDMLGEGARTDADAARYFHAYLEAIESVAVRARPGDPHDNDGVSVKLSALSCRYRTAAWPDLRLHLYPMVLHLAVRARAGNVPLTIDAEEAARLELSLGLIHDLATAPELAGWDGLGVVVQAYNLRADGVIDWLANLSASSGHRIAVRLVKGAYWDAEIKIAQEKGLQNFPVYTRKVHTDLAYLAHTRRLLTLSDRLYPQFASHNAHTLAAVEVMARELSVDGFEVQRLHGMGVAVHRAFKAGFGRRERVYAPVGGHRDLLAYLVRRLLENGANASFLHKLGDPGVPPADLARDPYETVREGNVPASRTGADLFAPQRRNSRGWDLDAPCVLAEMQDIHGTLPTVPTEATKPQADAAFAKARKAQPDWAALGADVRADVLLRIADWMERDANAFLSLLTQEAGKTLPDAVADLREAVDFCRYYAKQARALPAGCRARGVVVAISPWNFPLAIFMGQVAAALAAGNAVIAKPAEQTPRVAALAVGLMHRAGVPADVLHLLCGPGETLGAHLVSAGQADMVVFTGSTDTARRIHGAVAASVKPAAPLLAETGGLNAMIVDSSALLERAADDIVTSAFRSAGQRCSSLRMLYVQEDVYAPLIELIRGAADALKIGDPRDISVDVGPVIDAEAKAAIDGHVAAAQAKGQVYWQGTAPKGLYCAPAIIELGGIGELAREVFGPVLHIAPYRAGTEARIIADINAKGYGLTFGLQTRIRSKALECAGAAHVGNVYVNRNQIGAIVGSQPFGGHGLSGTGPKAGGPMYLRAFTKDAAPLVSGEEDTGVPLPGPDGEENRYSVTPRGRVLRLGADPLAAQAAGNHVEIVDDLPDDLSGVAAVCLDPGMGVDIAAVRSRLADAPGPLIPLITDMGGWAWLHSETHHCWDLTASGGNAALLARIDG
ncbi:MAG: L-glutamate gamma-semialdehyde dehydrogenase [Rhodospirillales bacterium]